MIAGNLRYLSDTMLSTYLGTYHLTSLSKIKFSKAPFSVNRTLGHYVLFHHMKPVYRSISLYACMVVRKGCSGLYDYIGMVI
jgi:hypothetical protein